MLKLRAFNYLTKRWKWIDISEAGGGENGSAQPSLAIANSTGVVIDTTTYDDPYNPEQKMAVVVFPEDQPALAFAIEGDAFPRMVLMSDTTDGFYFGDGTSDPAMGNSYINGNANGVNIPRLSNYLNKAGVNYVSSDYTIGDSFVNGFFRVDDGVTITLPETPASGATFIFRKSGSGAPIVLDGNGYTFESGNETLSLAQQGQVVHIIWTGTWVVVSNSVPSVI